MNRTLKRILATASMAPFAVIASVVPAGATDTAIDVPTVTGGGTAVLTAACVHPLDNTLLMTYVITLEGATGSDSNDVVSTTVTMSDADRTDAFDHPNARAERISIEYWDDDTISPDTDSQRKIVYDDSRRVSSRNGSSSDGAAGFSRGRDNVGFVRVIGEWSRGSSSDAEDLTCTTTLPNP